MRRHFDAQAQNELIELFQSDDSFRGYRFQSQFHIRTILFEDCLLFGFDFCIANDLILADKGFYYWFSDGSFDLIILVAINMLTLTVFHNVSCQQMWGGICQWKRSLLQNSFHFFHWNVLIQVSYFWFICFVAFVRKERFDVLNWEMSPNEAIF